MMKKKKSNSLLEQVADYLISEQIVVTYQEFSLKICKRNPNYFSYQRFKSRDFSLSALIECIKSFRKINKNLQRYDSIWESEIIESQRLEQEMMKLLKAKIGADIKIT
jgi:hypothetical protein